MTSFTYEDCENIITDSFEYDKDLNRTLKLIPKEGFECVQDFKDWVKKNVKTAIFASVAFQWIRANILNEISRSSQIVHIPKSQIPEGINPNKNHHIVFIDELQESDDDNGHIQKQKYQEFEQSLMEEEIDPDDMNKQITVRKFLYELMSNLNNTERRLIKKYFGIGMPCAMTFPEIANSEGVQISKIKYIVSQAIKKMSNKATDKQKDTIQKLLIQ